MLLLPLSQLYKHWSQCSSDKMYLFCFTAFFLGCLCSQAFFMIFYSFFSRGLSNGPHFQAYKFWVEDVWGHISEAECPHQTHLDCNDNFFQGRSWVVLFFDLPKSGPTLVQNSTLSCLQARKFVLAGLESLGLTFRPAFNCGRHFGLKDCFVSCASMVYLRFKCMCQPLPSNRTSYFVLCFIHNVCQIRRNPTQTVTVARNEAGR